MATLYSTGKFFLNVAISASLLLVTPIIDGYAQETAAPVAGVQEAPTKDKNPEPESGFTKKSADITTKYMVVAANALASETGRQILRDGGNAIDAMIATQLVLGLVEPQSSGLGGGAFLVYWDQRTQKLTTLDGREEAPMGVTQKLFLDPLGKPMEFMDAVVGGRSIGVPGTVRLLEAAHRKWGKLPWVQLFQPAIKFAEQGFPISARLNKLLAQEKMLSRNNRAHDYFYGKDGSALPVGFLLKNPGFAQALKLIAFQGAQAFYDGPIADEISFISRNHPTNPGFMTRDDLRKYRVIEREPVCGPYRHYKICGMGPPGSGVIAILQILGILQSQDLTALKPGPEAAHWFIEAGSLAFADRALYVADPDFVKVPTAGLLDSTYLKDRMQSIDPHKSMGTAKAGTPLSKEGFYYAPSTQDIERGTTHISIIDEAGNALSMTSTIEDGFGSRQMTKFGFLLNNELTDFNFNPIEDDKPVANRVEPGKRPRSTMSPLMIFDEKGKIYAVLGSAGGAAIASYVAKTIIAMIDWNMEPQQAVDYANFVARNKGAELEINSEADGWKAALEAMGHKVKSSVMASGTQAIMVTPQGYIGGSDGRREGVAIGD